MTFINLILRLVLFGLILGLFVVQQGSLVLLISRRQIISSEKWVSVTFLIVLLPYVASFLSQIWKSSFTTRGKLREWPHWGALLLGTLAALAEGYVVTSLFVSLIHKIPSFLLCGILNSALIVSTILSKKNSNQCRHYTQVILKILFAAVVITSGILLSTTDYMDAKDTVLLFLYLFILSAIITSQFQEYIHSTNGKGFQNSALLYVVLKMFTVVIVTYILQRNNNTDMQESIRLIFSSLTIPDEPEIWLCVTMLISSFLCQAIGYFKDSSIKTKLNVYFPMLLSSIVISVLTVLLWKEVLVDSHLHWVETINHNLNKTTFSVVYYLLYLLILGLLVLPIILLFICGEVNICGNYFSFNTILTPQYLLSKTHSAYRTGYQNLRNKKNYRRIFICTTMYQESTIEMDRLLTSIKNVSYSEMLKRQNISLESHIFLDNGANEQDIKQFGLQLLGLIEENLIKDNEQGVMLFTPYGIQLSWKLESGIQLFVHLKDIKKVKAKKRWSQVMYMKYILNYRSSKYRRISGNLSKHSSYASLLSAESTSTVDWQKKTISHKLTVPDARPNNSGHDDLNSMDTEITDVPYVEIFVGDTSSVENLSTKHYLPTNIFTAVDTHEIYADDFDLDTDDYILATDADMTFVDNSIMDVLHMCEADPAVGAICGRTRPKGVHIHPIVWLQMFDYAKDFWIIKSSQNIIGSVMCCPGCFSMYKLEAVRDVVDEYSGPVENMEDVFTKDNGEDRWMCTLMMLKGWKLRYSSNARNTTFCPEDTTEFMKQRRRWLLSDYANAVLVIRKLKNLLSTNGAFSVVYTLYLLQLFLIMLLYPGSTIVMLCLGLELATGAPLVIVTPVITTVVFAYSLLLLTKISLTVQMVVTKLLIMVFGIGTVYIFVSSTVIIFKDLAKGFESGTFEHAEGFLVMIVIGSYIYGALLYPSDIWILITGVVYLFFIPFMNLILPLYAVCNIVDQSWGTRDNQTATVPKYLQLPKIKRKMKKARKSQQVETTSLQSLSASSLSINDYNQSEYEFWEDLVASTVGANISNGISDNERILGLRKLRKKALIFFFVSNFICIIVLVGFYAFLMQTFSSKSTFSIVMAVTLGLSPLIQISGSTVYRIDDILTRVGRWVTF